MTEETTHIMTTTYAQTAENALPVKSPNNPPSLAALAARLAPVKTQTELDKEALIKWCNDEAKVGDSTWHAALAWERARVAKKELPPFTQKNASPFVPSKDYPTET